MKDYPLDVVVMHTDDGIILMSKGHHDHHAFMLAAKAEDPDLPPMSNPEHRWVRAVPDSTGDHSCLYVFAEAGGRGVFPATYSWEPASPADVYIAPKNPLISDVDDIMAELMTIKVTAHGREKHLLQGEHHDLTHVLNGLCRGVAALPRLDNMIHRVGRGKTRSSLSIIYARLQRLVESGALQHDMPQGLPTLAGPLTQEVVTRLTDMLLQSTATVRVEIMPTQVPDPDKLPAQVLDSVHQALGEAYDCTRCWSAWGHGTMTQDDFDLIAHNQERVMEIAHAAVTAWVAYQSRPRPATQIEISE